MSLTFAGTPLAAQPPETTNYAIDLRPSDTLKACPYKGVATYWSLDGIEDAAWSYEDPLQSVLKARGNVCFDAEKVEVREVS
jgi:uncharacterized protein (DUF427 family)